MKTVEQVKNEVIQKLQGVNATDLDFDNISKTFSAIALCESCGTVSFPEDIESAYKMAEKCGYDIIKNYSTGDVFKLLNQ